MGGLKRDANIWKVLQHKEQLGAEYDPVNRKLQYLNDKMRHYINQQEIKATIQHCQLRNIIVRHIYQLAEEQPLKAARLLLQGNKIMAIKAGEALAISPCTDVLPEIVQWDHKINRTCFKDLPVYLANQ